jgi:hypothetical protein
VEGKNLVGGGGIIATFSYHQKFSKADNTITIKSTSFINFFICLLLGGFLVLFANKSTLVIY